MGIAIQFLNDIQKEQTCPQKNRDSNAIYPLYIDLSRPI